VSSQPFPNTDQLRAMYVDIFSNSAVTAVSYWIDPNCSAPTDEAAYLTKVLETGDAVLDHIELAIEGIRN